MPEPDHEPELTTIQRNSSHRKDFARSHSRPCFPLSRFVFLSLLIGVAFFSRHIAGFVVTHGSYNPLVYNPTSIRTIPPPSYSFIPDDILWDETRAYARWTQEVLRGDLQGQTMQSYQPYVAQKLGRDGIWLRDRLGPFILAGMASVAGNVPAAFAIADFIFPAAVALALFWTAWLIRPSSSFAIAVSSLITFFPWADLRNGFQIFHGSHDFTSMLLRTPYPQVSLLLLILFLAAYITVHRRPGAGTIAALVLATTANFYAYSFSWLFVCCWLASGLILEAVRYFVRGEERRLKSLKLIYALSGATGISLVLSLPVWLQIVLGSDISRDSFFRLNGTLSHSPNIKYTILLGVAMLLALSLKNWERRLLAATFCAASLLVLDQQLLTGKTIQPVHWTGYFIQPLAWLFLADFLWSNASPKYTDSLQVCGWILLISGLCFNTLKLSVGATEAAEYNREDPSFMELLRALNSKQVTGCGFLTNDPYLAELLPGYLRQKHLSPWYMDPVSDSELRQLKSAAGAALGFRSLGDSNPALADVSNANLSSPNLILRPDKLMYIFSRHRPFSASTFETHSQFLLNGDFLVLTPRIGTPACGR